MKQIGTMVRCVRVILIALCAIRCATVPPVTDVPGLVTGETGEPPGIAEEAPVDFIRVFSTRAVVRDENSPGGTILQRTERWDRFPLLGCDNGWCRIRLKDDREGWIPEEDVVIDKHCPEDRDEPILISEPVLHFTEGRSRGHVILEAEVGADGVVKNISVVSNTTGSEALALQAELELKEFQFDPPIMDCQPQPFTYSYKRNF